MKFKLIRLILLAALTQFIRAEVPASVVRLFVDQKQVLVGEAAQQQLRSAVISLLQSSSLHSGGNDGVFSFTGVQQDYRDAVCSGAYVVVSLSPAQKFATLAGDVSAAEIVVGLRSPGARNCVFTIDDHGVLTSYAKYSGSIFIKLKQILAEQRL